MKSSKKNSFCLLYSLLGDMVIINGRSQVKEERLRKKDTVLVCKGINKEIKIYYKG